MRKKSLLLVLCFILKSLLLIYVNIARQSPMLFKKLQITILLIPESINNMDLKEILKYNFKAETLGFNNICKKSQKINLHIKYRRFSILPKILI